MMMTPWVRTVQHTTPKAAADMRGFRNPLLTSREINVSIGVFITHVRRRYNAEIEPESYSVIDLYTEFFQQQQLY